MKQFAGFPARMQFTSIPNFFFSTVLPQMTDMAELKTTLHIFEVLYRKRGYPRFTTFSELSSSISLMSGLRETGKPPEDALRAALEMATTRGTLLHLEMDGDKAPEDIYFLNAEENRKAVAKIRNGELTLTGLKTTRYREEIGTQETPDIFRLYEENIGMLTPMIAEELRDAEKHYPTEWIGDAVKEAVSHNKRNWKYIAAILEHWSLEGRGDGTHQRDSSKDADPDKYIKGKYGHLVRRK
ncbi:MAG: DnaD domain protein [Chloroflexi bacterium]|nr:DnaD domain protein [Chloroflexota bacterium]